MEIHARFQDDEKVPSSLEEKALLVVGHLVEIGWELYQRSKQQKAKD